MIVCFSCRTQHHNDLKKFSSMKRTDFWHLVLWGWGSCLRNRHLILWSLGTLTGQQRFYGTGLVTRKGRYYHPLSVLPEAGCIAGSLKLLKVCRFMLWWFACNVPDSGVSEYSTTDTFNSNISKYYVVKKPYGFF